MLTVWQRRKLKALARQRPRYVIVFHGGPVGSWRTTVRVWERMESDGYHTGYQPRWVGYFYFITDRGYGYQEEFLVSIRDRRKFAAAVAKMKSRQIATSPKPN